MKAEVKAGPEQVMLHVGRRFATYRNVKYGRNSIKGVKEGATGVNSHNVPYKIPLTLPPSSSPITQPTHNTSPPTTAAIPQSSSQRHSSQAPSRRKEC